MVGQKKALPDRADLGRVRRGVTFTWNVTLGCISGLCCSPEAPGRLQLTDSLQDGL